MQVGIRQGSVMSPLVFAIVVDVITEYAREGLLITILHADDLVLISESTVNFCEKFLKWKEAFESRELKVYCKKTKVTVNGSKAELVHVLSAANGDGKFNAEYEVS